MGKQSYQSVTHLSFGEVQTELKPASDFQDQQQVLDAMLVSGHTALCAWVVDNTIDNNPQNGKQEQIKASIKDGSRKIADLQVSVPTTSNFSKAMFEQFIQSSIVPAIQKTAKSYPSTRTTQQSAASSQSQLGQQILPSMLEQTAKVSPKQLQTR